MAYIIIISLLGYACSGIIVIIAGIITVVAR